MDYIKIPSVLKKMYEIFNKSGFQAYLVGGAVRDMMMGIPPHDYDVATNASPQQVMMIFNRVIPTGITHGTVTVHLLGYEIETTTFRTETGYSDGRHPDHVEYAGTIEDDLSRRDFTMNAIAVNLADGSIVDPFGGRKDIQSKLIKTVGNPDERFSEDGLRPIRAIRFASQLGFVIQKDTYSVIFKDTIHTVTAGISIERFRDEFTKILESDTPSVGLKKMEETGIMKLFIPEFLPARNCLQADMRGFHEFDVLDHLFYSCDGGSAKNQRVRLAALFHDIGKPSVQRTEHTDAGDIFTFYNHEITSAEITRKTLVRLRFPNITVDAVTHLVRQHMFHYEENWTDAAVRRFIIRVQPEYLDDLYDLRLADIYGMHNSPVTADSQAVKELNELKDRIAALTAQMSALSIRDLAIKGTDLIAAGIPAGKKMGLILSELLETVIDDPKQNTKETLLDIAQKISKKYA